MKDVFGDESEGNEDRDRLSELPNTLILLILSLLPMKDVVRTSVLSQQWKDLWTTIPVLDFGVHKYVDPVINCSNNCASVFLNAVLKLWKGTKIIKFGVVVNCRCSAISIDSWLDFAMDHGVEELSVCSYTNFVNYYSAPLRLFSYSTLTKLTLWYCDMRITENVHWNRLKHLEIKVSCLEDDVIDKILAGAPQLEVLDLEVREEYENLIIHSSSLKQLKIVLNLFFDGEANTSLTICAPNLQTLAISETPCWRYSVMNLSSVKDLTLDLQRDPYFDDSLGGVIGEMLRQFFPTIVCAEKVSLSMLCMEALGALERKYLLSLSSHFKFVRVRYFYDVLDIPDLYRISSELEGIVIQHRSSYLEEEHQVMREELEYAFEISCSSGDEKLMFLFMEFLLENYDGKYEMEIWANPVGRKSKSF